MPRTNASFASFANLGATDDKHARDDRRNPSCLFV